MGVVAVALGASSRSVYIMALGSLLLSRTAIAFPASDASNPSVVPTPSESTPTESDLRHQLQLQSGFGAAGGAGWTIVPSASLQEMFTDNVFQTATNRRWDLVTLVSPGISVVGDVPNAQVRLN